MATIYERFNKDGTSTARVQIRRRGLPVLNMSFSCIEDAKIWVKLNEYKYISDPDLYLKWIEKERLNLRREREFKNG